MKTRFKITEPVVRILPLLRALGKRVEAHRKHRFGRVRQAVADAALVVGA